MFGRILATCIVLAVCQGAAAEPGVLYGDLTVRDGGDPAVATPAVKVEGLAFTLTWGEGKTLYVRGDAYGFEQGPTGWKKSWVRPPTVRAFQEYGNPAIEYAFPFTFANGPVFLYLLRREESYVVILDTFNGAYLAPVSDPLTEIPMGSMVRRMFDPRSAADLDRLAKVLHWLEKPFPTKGD